MINKLDKDIQETLEKCNDIRIKTADKRLMVTVDKVKLQEEEMIYFSLSRGKEYVGQLGFAKSELADYELIVDESYTKALGQIKIIIRLEAKKYEIEGYYLN